MMISKRTLVHLGSSFGTNAEEELFCFIFLIDVKTVDKSLYVCHSGGVGENASG